MSIVCQYEGTNYTVHQPYNDMIVTSKRTALNNLSTVPIVYGLSRAMKLPDLGYGAVVPAFATTVSVPNLGVIV